MCSAYGCVRSCAHAITPTTSSAALAQPYRAPARSPGVVASDALVRPSLTALIVA